MARENKNAWILLTMVCVSVISIYVGMARSGFLELLSPNPADAYYNLLVQGFRDGQLNLKKEVPAGLAQLPDPYDPAANVVYRYRTTRMYDLSYYKGRLYLYFGVTPALILFWPYVALTGHYLFHRQAVVIFCAIGFLASVGLLCALWRRYFAEISVGVVAACALALGLTTGMPLLLSRSEVYEVSISCGYMLTMLALVAIWRSLHETERQCRWLAAASLAYGLAVGARPSLLFGAAILLVPVAQAGCGRRRVGTLLLGATGPIVLIGLCLILYNARRFGNPFEFGQSYQLAAERQAGRQFFSPRFLWFNLRVYFLEPARWSPRFPFVHEIIFPPVPRSYGFAEKSFGILTNIPFVWLALASPLAWRTQSGPAASTLRWFVTAVTLLFATCALTLGMYWWVSFRYEVDFLPSLLLLAVAGVFGLERALADRPIWRRAARCGWGLLLGFSVAFNLLASVEHFAEAHNNIGIALGQAGRFEEAINHYKRALWIIPSDADAQSNLAIALQRTGRIPEAIAHYEQALQIKPDFAEAHYNLGVALEETGRPQDAINHYDQALRIKPDLAEAQKALARLQANR